MYSIAVLSSSNIILTMIKDMLQGFADIYSFKEPEEFIDFIDNNETDLLILERTIGKYSARSILEGKEGLPPTLLLVADKYIPEQDGDFFSFILRKPFQKEELREVVSYLIFKQTKSEDNNKAILVVDDSKIARDIAKSTISIMGYNTLEASNGKEALEILKKLPMTSLPLLVLTDQEMPEMNGIELAKSIRENENICSIPVIMATSLYDNIALKNEAFTAGVNEFIPKPFEEQQLQNTVKKILETDNSKNINKKILLIDDSNSRRRAMASVLKSVGFNIITTNNAQQFIQLIEDNTFDLCLIDFILAETSGTKLIEEVRTKLNIECPIIIYTAFDNIHAKKKLREIYEAGANDYLLAPFEIEELVFKVRTWLNHYNLLIEYKNKEKLLIESTTYDLLTGVLNRFNILKRGEEYFSLCIRKNFPLAVLYMDIDYFKNVNDTYGHNIGDLVLKKFAKTIDSNIRKEDVFGRLGGEEFLAVLPFADKKSALIVAEKLRKSVENIDFEEVEGLKITVSIGLSTISPGIKTFDKMITEADKMLYKAKETGRNKVVYQ